MALAVIISVLRALNGWTMICAEMPLVAADDGLFPERFSRSARAAVLWVRDPARVDPAQVPLAYQADLQ